MHTRRATALSAVARAVCSLALPDITAEKQVPAGNWRLKKPKSPRVLESTDLDVYTVHDIDLGLSSDHCASTHD